MVRKATSGYLPDLAPGPVSADDIVDTMLAAIISGELRAGTLVHDESIARHLQISRTPVREAFLRLRTIGVLETAPSRFTRITLVPPHQTAEAFVVWVWLWRMLNHEVLPLGDRALIEALTDHHRRFSEALDGGRYDELASANFQFFEAPLALCTNAVLVEKIRATTYLLRLGDSQLPEPVDLWLIDEAQRLLVTAFTEQDMARAAEANDLLASLHIPGYDVSDEQMELELADDSEPRMSEPHRSELELSATEFPRTGLPGTDVSETDAPLLGRLD